MEPKRTPNRLSREKSPYLLQHAFNPVDWYPWGEEAFARARADGKPLFLSIGYSTCHWCHVMERESFENDEIAGLLNSMFVPVKVDREERPDVDRISMTALQAMGQQGGWPLSMFLTPDLRPFYGGTYFPPVSRYGRAGFPDVLRRIHELWTQKRETVLESAAGIAGFLREISTRPAYGTDGTRDPLTGCYEMVRRTFDAASGGFGGGPKFPRPVVFDALLRYHRRTGEPEALMMVTDTLRAIARGGIADHLGGGFHRYAVDSEWRIPHFEKMLYDQAQLATAFLDAHRVTGDAAFAEAARGIFTYVRRDLTHPLGGFTSAEDADSLRPGSEEQGEGAFYVWTRAAVMNELGEAEGALFCEAYGVEEEGNAPFDPQHEFTGLNILYRAAEDEDLASSRGTTPEDVRARLARSRDRLLAVRAARPRPLLDDKVITAWNGLMIGAFARGFRVLREPAYREAAVRSARFVRSTLSGDGGKTLYRRWRDGRRASRGNWTTTPTSRPDCSSFTRPPSNPIGSSGRRTSRGRWRTGFTTRNTAASSTARGATRASWRGSRSRMTARSLRGTPPPRASSPASPP